MSDHELAVLGLVIGIAGILAGVLTSYYFYLKARERADPRYLLQFEPLVGSSSGAMKDVSLLFKGVEAADLNRCILVLWNRGAKVITHDAIAENDKIIVHLPDGSAALGAGVSWSSRAAVGLSASCVGSCVTIDFDFLDENDGGIIEILYQGDRKTPPTLTGSIMGAPKGIRSSLGTLPIEDIEAGEGDTRIWRGWMVLAAVLCASAAVSAVALGPAYSLSVIIYTLITELVIAAALVGFLHIYARRAIGFVKFWRETPLSGKPRIKVD